MLYLHKIWRWNRQGLSADLRDSQTDYSFVGRVDEVEYYAYK